MNIYITYNRFKEYHAQSLIQNNILHYCKHFKLYFLTLPHSFIVTIALYKEYAFIWNTCAVEKSYKIKCVSLIYRIFNCPHWNTQPRVIYPTHNVTRRFFGRSSLLIFRSTEHQNDILKGRRTKFDIRLKVLTGLGKTFSENIQKVILKLLRMCAQS